MPYSDEGATYSVHTVCHVEKEKRASYYNQFTRQQPDKQAPCLSLPPLFVDCASKNGVKSRVDVLGNVLDNKCLSIGDGRFDHLQPLPLSQLNHAQAVILFSLTQPFDSLSARRYGNERGHATRTVAGTRHTFPTQS